MESQPPATTLDTAEISRSSKFSLNSCISHIFPPGFAYNKFALMDLRLVKTQVQLSFISIVIFARELFLTDSLEVLHLQILIS